MPFLTEVEPAGGIRAGIWKIEETAGELLGLAALNTQDMLKYTAIRHEMRRKHWLASRVLLNHMLSPLSPAVSYFPSGKPYLDSGSHRISVTHAGRFAAVACSENSRVGIDIEEIRDRILRVTDRFMTKSELDSLDEHYKLEQIYIFWGGKEALYKLYGEPGLDFRNDIRIKPFDYFCSKNKYCTAEITANGRYDEYMLYYQQIDNYMMVVAY
jgi:phosphopantetheinyl transferase